MISGRGSGGAAAVFIVALLAASGCGRAGEPGTAAPTRPATGAEAADSLVARVTLTAEAAQRAGIATEVVHKAPFAVTLSLSARLSPAPETPEELEARLVYESAEARFHRASSEVERVRKLYAQDVVAAKAVQAAEAEFAQARVERMRADTALRSLGIDVSRPSAYPRADAWALADIYDPQVPQVKPGARAWVRVESFPGEAFPGRVVSLASFLKPQTRTLTVRLAIEDPHHRLRPQEPAIAEVEVAERAALSVPAPAVLYEAEGRAVFLKRGTDFEKVRVRVGDEQAGRAEILDGIADGDEVVIRGAQILLGELFRARMPAGSGSEEEDDEGGP